MSNKSIVVIANSFEGKEFKDMKINIAQRRQLENLINFTQCLFDYFFSFKRKVVFTNFSTLIIFFSPSPSSHQTPHPKGNINIRH